ncbi:MAG: MFS transporter [Promethearchaeota archaeon]
MGTTIDNKKQKGAYILGFLPTTLLIGVFTLAYAKFFWDRAGGLIDSYFIFGLVIYGIINSLNDPIIGYSQDKTNTEKWGSKRIVWIKYFSPVLIIVYISMWFPWSMDNQFIMFLHFTISICAFDTVLNITTMAWMALLPEITMDLEERTKLNFVGGIIASFLGIVLLMVPLFVGNRQFFQMFNIITGIISLICYFIVVKFSKEKPEFQHEKIPPIKEAVKQTLKSRSFLCFIGYQFFKGINGAFSLTYVSVFWLLIGEEFVWAYFLIMVFVGYSSNLICFKIREKYGIKKIMLTYGLLTAVGGLLTFFLILNPAMEGFIWFGLVWTTFFGGSHIFWTFLQTLPIDQDEVEHGSRREGMFFGVNALLTKVSESIGPIIATVLLGAFLYVKGGTRAEQPAEAILGIKILFYVVSNVNVLFSMIFIYLYPISPEVLEELDRNLKEIHRKKKEKLISEGKIKPVKPSVKKSK